MRLGLSAAFACLAALALGACGDTIQDQPTSRSALEPIVLQQAYPVYWLGGEFRRLAITEAAHDPSGAYTIHYGDCTEGGQYTCVSPVSIVTSPDNSFIPGGAGVYATVELRGVRARLAQHGATIVIPTGVVVVSIYAPNAAQAREAAQTMVPINRVGVPDQTLAPPAPDTGYASAPLASQEPRAVHIPGLANQPVSRARQ
ncbi:MAG TPA: hypothetical protein VGY76_05160 [Solirubrobacteraceae bacterium]|nr:hypothetical protein [Solirubrobacteraceae bacterium]